MFSYFHIVQDHYAPLKGKLPGPPNPQEPPSRFSAFLPNPIVTSNYVNNGNGSLVQQKFFPSRALKEKNRLDG